MAPQTIIDLIEAFDRNLDSYRSPHYKEAEVRNEFIDPFLEALGWDMQNRRKYAESYKEVVHEPSLEEEFGSRAPDYSFGLLWTGLGVVWLLGGLKETNQTRLTIAVLTDLARQRAREQPEIALTPHS